MKHRIHATFATAAAVVLIVTLAGPAICQETDPNLFGDHVNFLYVSAEEFKVDAAPGSGGGDYHNCGDGYWCASDGTMVFAKLDLPAGAVVLGYRFLYEDSDPSGWIRIILSEPWYSAGSRGSSTINLWASSESGTPGVTEQWIDVDPDVTVQYRYWSGSSLVYSKYVMWVSFNGTQDLKFTGVLVSWKRQISSPPATATFDDVQPGDFGFQHVEALYASGITAGCDATHFCPDAPLTRVQMAVFLAKALGLHWDS